MHRTFALAKPLLLALVAAVCLSGGTASARPANPKQMGQVCIQQNGVYLASVRYHFHEHEGFRPVSYETTLAIGQNYCQNFWETDADVKIDVNVYLGRSASCKINLNGRSGQLTVVATGTSLDPKVACP